MKALLANMGFVLQISGIFIILPIILSFINNEMVATVGLFITATIFLIVGFSFNAFCERRELSYKSSCSLIVLVFILLSLIGAIPYIYVNISSGEIIQVVSDSIFEAASGFTTTGFSVISDINATPESILFYRGLTQFIGGIGIVLVLLAFFYPEAKLQDFAKGMGFSKDQKIKKTFFLIILIYCVYTIILIISSYLLGYRDIVKGISFVFSAISTGGFAPISDITSVATTFPMNAILVIGMVLGASNFFVIAGLFKRRFKEFFTSETMVFLIMAIIAISIATIFFGLSGNDSVFHIVSAMTNSGFSYVSMVEFSDGFKFFLVFLMLVGGASFSTAGGMKIFRFVLMIKAVRKAVYETLWKRLFKCSHSSGSNRGVAFYCIGLFFRFRCQLVWIPFH
jgi:trk system potassium uptake protein TrkH